MYLLQKRHKTYEEHIRCSLKDCRKPQIEKIHHIGRVQIAKAVSKSINKYPSIMEFSFQVKANEEVSKMHLELLQWCATWVAKVAIFLLQWWSHAICTYS